MDATSIASAVMTTEREWAVQIGDTSSYIFAHSEIHAIDIAAEHNAAEIDRFIEFTRREIEKANKNPDYVRVTPTRTIYRPVTRPRPSAWSRDIFSWE